MSEKKSSSKKRRNRLVVAVVALVSLATTAVWAGGHRGHFGAERMRDFVEWKVDRVLDDIDADEAQRKVVSQVTDELFGSFQALHADRADVHAQALALWNSDKPDAAAAHALVDARMDAMRDLAHQATDGLLKVHATLTPAQRAEVAEMVEKHRKGRWGH